MRCWKASPRWPVPRTRDWRPRFPPASGDRRGTAASTPPPVRSRMVGLRPPKEPIAKAFGRGSGRRNDLAVVVSGDERGRGRRLQSRSPNAARHRPGPSVLRHKRRCPRARLHSGLRHRTRGLLECAMFSSCLPLARKSRGPQRRDTNSAGRCPKIGSPLRAQQARTPRSHHKENARLPTRRCCRAIGPHQILVSTRSDSQPWDLRQILPRPAPRT